MYELDAADYDKVGPLFEAMDHHLAVNAILEGSVRAKVLVDHPTRPRAALTWRRHRFYLSGMADNDEFNAAVARFFSETIYPQGQASGEEMLLLYYEPHTWRPQIEWMLEGRFPITPKREFYQFQTLRTDWRALLPEGFVLQFVDRALMEQRCLANLEDLVKEMCSERLSAADFFKKSFGVCLIHGDEIVGWCLSEYNRTDRCEVGIEVLRPYRRRGLATVMASALVEYALSRGVSRIGWHNYASNVASSATARSVGFQKMREYPVYLAYLNEIDNLAVHGNICFQQKAYADALTWYERAFARGEAQNWAYRGAACTAALLGQPDAALGYLNQAVDKGLTQRELIENSEYLRSLRGREGWRALVGRLEREETD